MIYINTFIHIHAHTQMHTHILNWVPNKVHESQLVDMSIKSLFLFIEV